jgi:adenosylcobinamide-GDP ribazoletransferase
MKDSRIGAYGSMALWCLLALRVACLAALGAAAPWACMLAMAWGRWSSAPLVRLPSIGSGLAKEISAVTPRWTLWWSSALALAATGLAWWLGFGRAPWAGVAAMLACAAWAAYLMRRLGGQSGDLLGAGNQLAEAAALLTLVAL